MRQTRSNVLAGEVNASTHQIAASHCLCYNAGGLWDFPPHRKLSHVAESQRAESLDGSQSSDVDDQMLYEGIRSELSDFETFVGYIVAYIDQTS